MRILFLAFALCLAGCSREQPRAPDQPSAAIGNPGPSAGGLPDPPAPPPAAPSLPGLLPLGEPEIAAALGSAARCTLSDGGPPLLAATIGGALANDGGELVHLAPQASSRKALAEGGRFVGQGLAIEVRPGAIVERRGTTIAYDASVNIMRGGHGLATSHGPRWTCGG